MRLREFIVKRKNVLVLALLLLVSFVFLWTSGGTGLMSPKSVGLSIAGLFQEVGYGVSSFVGNTINSVQELSDLKAEYDSLVQKLNEYEKNQSSVNLLQIDNQRLKEALGFKQQIALSNIAAEVIGKEPGILFSTLTINKGFNQGIKKGMPVVTIQEGKQCLVGRVSFVAPEYAQVMPIFDSQSHIAGRLERSRYEGLLSGTGNPLDPLVMKFIDVNAKPLVQIGDEIITSGLNSEFPPNLLIGKIRSINEKNYETFLELEVDPIAQFSKLEVVFMLLQEQAGVNP